MKQRKGNQKRLKKNKKIFGGLKVEISFAALFGTNQKHCHYVGDLEAGESKKERIKKVEIFSKNLLRFES